MKFWISAALISGTALASGQFENVAITTSSERYNSCLDQLIEIKVKEPVIIKGSYTVYNTPDLKKFLHYTVATENPQTKKRTTYNLVFTSRDPQAWKLFYLIDPC